MDGKRESVPLPTDPCNRPKRVPASHPAQGAEDSAALVVGVVDQIADASVLRRVEADTPEIFLRVVAIDGMDTELDAVTGQVGQREVRLQHLIVAGRDAGAEVQARVAVEQVVPPPAANPDAAADRLPPEAVLEIEAVVGCDLLDGVSGFEPEQRPLELAAFVGLERLGFLGALLCNYPLARVLGEHRSGAERERHHEHYRRRPTQHRPRTISQAVSGIQLSAFSSQLSAKSTARAGPKAR